MLAGEDLRWAPGGHAVIDDVTLSVPAGAVVGLLGPNGSGKSSILRLLAGLRKPARGRVLLDGRLLAGERRRWVARRLAFLEQDTTGDRDLTLRGVVALGRTPHRSLLSARGPGDDESIDAAMAAVEIGHLAERRWSTLSGGERQRAHLARALAQQPDILLLDEPTNHLDIHHQVELLRILRASGLTVLAALHDLTLAAASCDHVILLSGGRVVAAGPPDEVLTAARIEQVFGVRCVVERGETTGRLIVSYR